MQMGHDKVTRVYIDGCEFLLNLLKYKLILKPAPKTPDQERRKNRCVQL